MANAFRKVGNFLGLVDDEEMYEATVALPETRRPRTIAPVSTPVRSVETPSYMKSSVVTEFVESPIERIVTLHPRVYSEVRSIGEHYRNGEPVIMNLTDMEESERKRVVDFASGLVFGHNGKIERVTSKVFLLTPPNVSVSNEEKSAVASASFFDQS
jgi:cell division inhibitor SepF